MGWGQILKSAPQLLLQSKGFHFGGVRFTAGLQSSGLGSFYKCLVISVAQENLSEWTLQSVPRCPSFYPPLTALETETIGPQACLSQRCHISQSPSPRGLLTHRERRISTAHTGTDPVLLPHDPSRGKSVRDLFPAHAVAPGQHMVRGTWSCMALCCFSLESSRSEVGSCEGMRMFYSLL